MNTSQSLIRKKCPMLTTAAHVVRSTLIDKKVQSVGIQCLRVSSNLRARRDNSSPTRMPSKSSDLGRNTRKAIAHLEEVWFCARALHRSTGCQLRPCATFGEAGHGFTRQNTFGRRRRSSCCECRSQPKQVGMMQPSRAKRILTTRCRVPRKVAYHGRCLVRGTA
jgi:hypothetical protein